MVRRSRAARLTATPSAMRCFVAFVLFCSRLCLHRGPEDLTGQPVSIREEWVRHRGLIVEQKETKATKNTQSLFIIVSRSRAAYIKVLTTTPTANLLRSTRNLSCDRTTVSHNPREGLQGPLIAEFYIGRRAMSLSGLNDRK
jgi:hypothetical protein